MTHIRALIPGALILVLALLAACGGGDDGGGDADTDGYPYSVQDPEDIDDRAHFPVGQVYDGYNTNPPTSGPHANAPAEWGVSDVAVPKEMLVHNMEHAGVVVWYNCNAGEALSGEECTQLRNDLSAVVLQEVNAGNRVVMSPYTSMTTRIALTSWGILDEFDEFDAARVSAFINTFECAYDPEHFCG